MKVILLAFLISSSLNLNLILPKNSAPRSDDGLFFEDLRILADSVNQGDWLKAIPKGLTLINKVSKMAKSPQSSFSPLLNFIGKGKKCPYRRCVKMRLRQCKKPARMFMRALWYGHPEKAQKVLKCLSGCLYKATLCKKK